MNKAVLVLHVVAASAILPHSARAQADTIRAVASSWVAQLAPGVDTALVYFNRAGNRQLGITYIQTTSKTPAGFLIVQQNIRPNGVVVSLDSIEVAAGSLAPIWHADATPRGRMRVEFRDGRMKGTSTDTAGRSTPVDTAVAAGALDFSTGGELVRLLPLKVGYSAVILTNDVHRGAIPVGVRVVGEEEIEVGGRRMKTWAVEETNSGRTTRHWIEQATRREVRVLVDMGSGGTMEMERRIR